MRFEYIPENDFEKELHKHFVEELTDRRSKYNTDERLFMLEEMLMKNQTAGVMESMMLKTLANKVEVMWGGGDEEPSIDQRVEILEAMFKRYPETVLELEQTKIRLKNAEADLRQALEKISSLEQSVAFLKSDMEGVRMSEKAMARVINTHADELDRLNKAVFDEDPPKVEEEEA